MTGKSQQLDDVSDLMLQIIHAKHYGSQSTHYRIDNLPSTYAICTTKLSRKIQRTPLIISH